MHPDTEKNSQLAKPSHNPLNDFISSERYIESLEKRLKKMKGREVDATSKDILSALEKAKETQMAQMLQGSSSYSCDVNVLDYSDAVINKTHTASQNKEEVVAIIYQDQLNQQHIAMQNSPNVDVDH